MASLKTTLPSWGMAVTPTPWSYRNARRSTPGWLLVPTATAPLVEVPRGAMLLVVCATRTGGISVLVCEVASNRTARGVGVAMVLPYRIEPVQFGPDGAQAIARACALLRVGSRSSFASPLDCTRAARLIPAGVKAAHATVAMYSPSGVIAHAEEPNNVDVFTTRSGNGVGVVVAGVTDVSMRQRTEVSVFAPLPLHGAAHALCVTAPPTA